jgi:predicted ATPase/DNA-binding SARP family transcriptional activator
VIAPDRDVSSLAIGLFGPFEVLLNGVPLPRLRSRKGQWLLALLALRHGTEVERTWLAGTLWPDSPTIQALASLRKSLNDLRGALGREACRLSAPTPHTLCLDLTGAEVDVVDFDAAMAHGDIPSLERAVSLRRGPLLEGCTEEWVFEERQAREQAYLAALETLAAHALSRGELEAAVRSLRLATAADPFRETAHRALMQALASGGNYAAAALVYRELRLLLHRDLNAEPDPESTALFERLRAEARNRAASPPPSRGAPSGTIAVRPPAESGRASASPPGYIPRPLASLVGREREARAVEAFLESARLVTLTGPGGVGKSRLAIKVAEDLVEKYPDGVWFVDLGSLWDSALVPRAVARALEVDEEPGCSVTQSLLRSLHPKQLLLVLDTCEHLVEGCACLVEVLLSGSPRLRILATSREALGLPGETAWRVPSLSVPDPGSRLRVEPDLASLVSQYEAVQLFVERAVAAAPTFTLTPRNAPAIVQVCQRLDGIPLAIELAAVRVKWLAVEQIAARLGDRFRLLSGARRTALPRHQTLRATMDWSYDLLSEAERRLLCRLSVFSGGFTLDAAEAVCAWDADGPCTPDDVLGLLGQLVDKSLVTMEEQGGEARYRLLETIREYGAEKLRGDGEDPITRERHRDWFLTLAERAESALRGPDQGPWLERLETEHDNLRAAVEWTLARGEAEVGLRLGGALLRFWLKRDYFREGRERLAGLLALPGAEAPTEARARVLTGAGLMANNQGDYTAARSCHEESLRIRQALGDRPGIATALNNLGNLALNQGDFTAAGALYEASLSLRREQDDTWNVACLINNLGAVAGYQGDYERAEALFTESLALFQELGIRSGAAVSLSSLGIVAQYQGDEARAAARFEESLMIFREVGEKLGIAGCLEGFAGLAESAGQPQRAAQLFGAAASLRDSLGAPVPPAERADYDRRVAATRAALGEQSFAAAWAAGRALTLEQAIAQALEKSLSI